MGASSDRAFYQGFPMLGRSRAQAWSYAPSYRRPRHFHSEPELNLVVAGEAIFATGSRVLRVRAGELLGFAPGQDHVLLTASPDLELLAVGIEARLSADILRRQPGGLTLPLRLSPPMSEFRRLVSRLSAAVGGGGEEQRIAELWEQVHDSSWARASSDGENLHVLTRRTVGLLAKAPELSRDALACQLHAHPTEVSRWLHRDLGMTLVQYRTRLRLLRFIAEIDQRSSDLTAAAFSAGFGSYSQCHRAFRAELDCAPRDFFAGQRERLEQLFLPLQPPQA